MGNEPFVVKWAWRVLLVVAVIAVMAFATDVTPAWWEWVLGASAAIGATAAIVSSRLVRAGRLSRLQTFLERSARGKNGGLPSCRWKDWRRGRWGVLGGHVMPMRLWVEQKGESYPMRVSEPVDRQWVFLLLPLPLLIVSFLMLSMVFVSLDQVNSRNEAQMLLLTFIGAFVVYRLAWRLLVSVFRKERTVGDWRGLVSFSVAPRADYYGRGGEKAPAAQGTVLLANFAEGFSVPVADTEAAAAEHHALHRELSARFMESRERYFTRAAEAAAPLMSEKRPREL